MLATCQVPDRLKLMSADHGAGMLCVTVLDCSGVAAAAASVCQESSPQASRMPGNMLCNFDAQQTGCLTQHSAILQTVVAVQHHASAGSVSQQASVDTCKQAEHAQDHRWPAGS